MAKNRAEFAENCQSDEVFGEIYENSTLNKKFLGDEGENRAAEFLENKGFKIVGRNFRTRGGEIDIIAEKEDLLVFAEVKTLPSGNVETLEHVLGAKKRGRIVETAKRFLANYRKYNDSCVRFDVLVVDMPNFPPVYHIESAFSE